MNSMTLQTRIKAPANTLRPFFSEFEKFGELHPYIRKVTKTGTNSYHISESLFMFGFIPMKPEYTAEVSGRNGDVIYLSHVKKGVDLEICIRFSEDPQSGITTISEKVTVLAHPLIAKIFLRTIRKAHTILFERLKTIVNP